MYFEVFIVGLLGGISPGPDFFVVVKNSLVKGRKIGSAAALGISLALTIHISYTILGFALIMQKNPVLFKLIQGAGAVYLIKLGLKAILSKRMLKPTIELDEDRLLSIQPHRDTRFFQGFKEGFLCNMLNPKAALFFLSIFSQFLTAETPLIVQWVYGGEIIIAVGGWFLILAALISAPFFRRIYGQYHHWLDRFLGGALLYYALRIIAGLFR